MKDIYLDIENTYYNLIEIPNNDAFDNINIISKSNYKLYYFITKYLDIEKSLLKKLNHQKMDSIFMTFIDIYHLKYN